MYDLIANIRVPILFRFDKRFGINPFLRFMKFDTHVHFLSMRFRGIIPVANSDGDSTSP